MDCKFVKQRKRLPIFPNKRFKNPQDMKVLTLASSAGRPTIPALILDVLVRKISKVVTLGSSISGPGRHSNRTFSSEAYSKHSKKLNLLFRFFQAASFAFYLFAIILQVFFPLLSVQFDADLSYLSLLLLLLV